MTTWDRLNVLCVAAAVLVISYGVWAQALNPSYAVLPTDTTGAVGYEATIYCTVANLGRHQVFWNIVQNTTGRDFTLGPFTNSQTSYRRFTFVGEASRGEYNLRIMNVSKSDEGTYTCIAADTMNVPNSVIETKAVLTVHDNPTPPSTAMPKCNRSPLGSLEPGVYMKGDVLTLTCSSNGGVPRPRLSWVRISGSETMANGNRPTGGYELQSTATGNRDVTTAVARITLSSMDHQAFYKCIQHHPAATASSPGTCTTPFSGSESLVDVRFKPEVKIVPNVVTVDQFETRTVTLSCEFKANPLPTQSAKILLPVNKTATYPNGPGDESLVEVEISAEDVGKDFYCRVVNTLGVGEDRVEIKLGPLPTWLILVIMATIAVVLFVFVVVIYCVLCVDRPDEVAKGGDVDRLRFPAKTLQSASLRHEGEDEIIDDGTVPNDIFQGGQESAETGDRKPIVNSDFETGETGPRYQNVNAAYQEDFVEPDPPSDVSVHEDTPAVDDHELPSDEVFSPDVPPVPPAPPLPDIKLSRV